MFKNEKALYCPLCHGTAKKFIRTENGFDGKEYVDVYKCRGKRWDNCPLFTSEVQWELYEWNFLARNAK